jgi:hypothetical protein
VWSSGSSCTSGCNDMISVGSSTYVGIGVELPSCTSGSYTVTGVSVVQPSAFVITSSSGLPLTLPNVQGSGCTYGGSFGVELSAVAGQSPTTQTLYLSVATS